MTTKGLTEDIDPSKIISFAVYDETGRVTSSAIGPLGDALKRSGNLYIGEVDWRTHYIKNGEPVAFPLRPSEFHTFNFITEEWVPDLEAAWAWVRRERDRRIAISDWTVLPDVSLTNEKKLAWGNYRQALRDITEQLDPLNILWPSKPS